MAARRGTSSERQPAQRGNDLLRPHTPGLPPSTALHNYVEMMYMVAGETRHLINDREQVTLHAGELLMMNHRATHAIERAEEGDLAVNIMVQPAFFQEMLAAVGEDNPLGRFLVGSLTDRPEALSSLVFHVAQDVPVQCVLESMVATLTAGGAPCGEPGGHDAAVPACSAVRKPWRATSRVRRTTPWCGKPLREIQDHYAAPSPTALAAGTG